MILAHSYQQPEIYEIADFIGDSGTQQESGRNGGPIDSILRIAAHGGNCKILSPEKTVLLPAMDAGCPMADMITADDVLELKKIYPEAAVVTYVNSSARPRLYAIIAVLPPML